MGFAIGFHIGTGWDWIDSVHLRMSRGLLITVDPGSEHIDVAFMSAELAWPPREVLASNGISSVGSQVVSSVICLRRSILDPDENQGQDNQEYQLDWVER